MVQYVDKRGTIVAQYAYDAFGNTMQKGGVKADELKMRFSTKYSDDESGLYYFGHRFYSPHLARWLSRDPIEEDGGLNLYAYCGNDSVKWVDPLGLEIFVLKKMVGTIPPNGWGDFGRNKKNLEAIVDCPAAARRRREKEESIFCAKKARIAAANDALDAPGGPHGH